MTTRATATKDATDKYTDGVTQFDLLSEIANAETRKPWPTGVFSKTLVKEQDMRVVLSIMEPGAQMKSHHADGSISVQVLRGTGDIHKILQPERLGPPHVRVQQRFAGGGMKIPSGACPESRFCATMGMSKSAPGKRGARRT